MYRLLDGVFPSDCSILGHYQSLQLLLRHSVLLSCLLWIVLALGVKWNMLDLLFLPATQKKMHPDQCCAGWCRKYKCKPNDPFDRCPPGYGWHWHCTGQFGHYRCNNGHTFPACDLLEVGQCEPCQ